MSEIEHVLKKGFYYTGQSWIPDFLAPIPRPYCNRDQALAVLERFKIDDGWKTEDELNELLCEYGIFSYTKWEEEIELFGMDRHETDRE